MADFRAPKENISFDRGKDIVFTRWYLDDAMGAVNLTGWKARMKAKLDIDDILPITGWDFTTETTGLEIVTQASETFTLLAGSVINDVTLTVDTVYTVANPYGVKVHVPAAITSVKAFDSAVYDIEIEDPAGRVYPFRKGTLKASKEVTD